MKTLRWALAFLLLAGPAYGQETPADSLTEEIRTETVRMRGFVRASETQATKVLALIDSLRALPADTSGAPAPPDTLPPVQDTLPAYQDTLPPVQDTLPPVQDTVVVQDTLPAHQDTLPPVQDTVVVEVCPPDWTCTPPTPAAPTMYVAGWADTIPGAISNGLHVAWEAMEADSFRVVGSKADGSDEWTVIVPGADTVYRRELAYDTVTAMRGCVSALRHDVEGPEACEEMDWAPMTQPGEPPGMPGRPEFSLLEDGRVEVTWPPAAGATSYRYWYTGHSESEELTTPTNSVILDDFSGGGFFCARGGNEAGWGTEYRCNAYTPPGAGGPDPPAEGDLSLVVVERLQHVENEPEPDPHIWDVTNMQLTDWDEKTGIVGNDCTTCGMPWMHPGHGYRFIVGSWSPDVRPIEVVAADSFVVRVNGQTFRGSEPVPPDADWIVPQTDSVVVEWTAWPGPDSGRWAMPVRCYGGPPWTFEERGASC